MNVLEERLELAEQGRALWHSLEEKYPKKTLFLLFCEEGMVLKNDVVTFLPDYVEKKGYDCSVILETEQSFQEQVQGSSVETLTKEEGEALLALYEMYQFTPSLVIVSLDRPTGRKLSHLKAHLSAMEIVKACLLL